MHETIRYQDHNIRTAWLILTNTAAVLIGLWVAGGPLLRMSLVVAAAPGPERWEKSIAEFEQRDSLDPPPSGAILFVGSSSIRLWNLRDYFPEYVTINRGFGGSQVEDSLRYADRIILAYHPRTVVVYAGDNDIAAGKSPKRVADDYAQFVEKIHGQHQDTRIVYIGIKPSISRWSLIESIREANRLIHEFCQRDTRLGFVDVDHPMLGADGKPRPDLFVSDGLHLSHSGYRLWARLVKQQLLDEIPENWPEFRGPTGNGNVANGKLPTTWSESTNVVWKTAIHGRGWSSPVVWGDQIWMTTATEDGKQMFAVCVDRDSGQVVHDILVFTNDAPREKHLLNSYASPSPVIEQGRVYVHFGSYGTACLDTNSGDVIWARRDLPCNHWRGPGSSPILHDSKLFIHFDGFDHQYVVALDKRSGSTVWRVDRDIDYQTDNGDIMKAFCTPMMIEVDGDRQLISPSSKATLAYNPGDGKELWRVRYDEFSATARPLHENGILYINTGFGKAKLIAIRTGGNGDVTDTHVNWTARRGIGSKSSPLLVDGLLYSAHDQGTATCVDAATGEIVWTQRLGGQFSASPISANGHIFLFDHDGQAVVIRPGRQFDQIAINPLDDGCMASPAVAGNALIVRTRTSLYRIEVRSGK